MANVHCGSGIAGYRRFLHFRYPWITSKFCPRHEVPCTFSSVAFSTLCNSRLLPVQNQWCQAKGIIFLSNNTFNMNLKLCSQLMQELDWRLFLELCGCNSGGWRDVYAASTSEPSTNSSTPSRRARRSWQVNNEWQSCHIWQSQRPRTTNFSLRFALSFFH